MKNILARKQCSRCKELKFIGDFYRNKTKSDGLCNVCKTCSKAKFREWRAEHPENPETMRDRKLNWIKGNLSQARETYKRSVHNYRARKKGNGGRYTKKEWQGLKEFYNYTCLCCKRREPEVKLEPDHILPISLGGTNAINNLQPLCRSCNARKNNRHIDYRPDRGAFSKSTK